MLASFRGERSIAEICREHDISETLLRRWRDQMMGAPTWTAWSILAYKLDSLAIRAA